MKFNKCILGLAAVGMLVATSASAALDNDVFATTRIMQIGAPGLIAVNANLTTNGPVDLIGYTGRGVILVTLSTNGTGAAAFTATVETGATTNSWTTLSNYALINSTTTINYTNLYYSTNYTVANTYLLPFTVTSPTAATAGFANPYPAPNQWTNSGAATCIANGTTVIGVNLTDSQRYLHVIISASGVQSTNGTEGLNISLLGNRYLNP